MSGVTPTKDNTIIAADGFFYVYQGEGKDPVQMSFMSLMIELGLYALKNSRDAFQVQFERAEEKVRCMEALNTVIQKINNIKTQFKDDAKGDANANASDLRSSIDAFNRKYPSSQITYNSDFFSDSNKKVTKKGVETLNSNCQTLQSTLSSENEQQSMRTNQAMNRSSGFLQQLQSMMQSAREALMASAKTGGA